jgi:general secretion pathway protein A
MYYQHFGLTEPPFHISVNPKYLFMSPRHREALAHLLYGVGRGDGFILLTGEVGTGKTTINRAFLSQLPEHVDVAYILNPALSVEELLATACDELGVAYEAAPLSLKTLTDALHHYLVAASQRGRKTVLMIDEAQHLSHEVLEHIRLLTNLETDEQKLLQIILIGQPELMDKLNRPELRQLNQRITARYALEPLLVDETTAYLAHRLRVAGFPSQELPFTRAAIRSIHRASGGIPRLINLVADRSLLGAYGQGKQHVDGALVRRAAREVLPRRGAGTNQRRNVQWGVASLLVIAVVIWAVLGQGDSEATASGSQLPEAVGNSPSVTPSSQGSAGVNEANQPLQTEYRAGETLRPEDALGAQRAQAAGSAPERAPAYLYGESRVWAPLWIMHSNDPVPAVPCQVSRGSDWACVNLREQTWESLRRLQRPLLLHTLTAAGLGARTLLLSIQGRDALLYTEAGLSSVSLITLSALWTGEVTLLWQPPADWHSGRDSDEARRYLADMAQAFATWDGQSEPLSTGGDNVAMQQRIRLFQRSQGLPETGDVDVPTWLAFEQIEGRGIVLEQALSRLTLWRGGQR